MTVELGVLTDRGSLVRSIASEKLCAAGVLCFLCISQVVLWAIGPDLVNAGLPTNVLEVALWGREWLIVSYKHPNLPGWILQIVDQLSGTHAIAAYLVSQSFVIATLVFVYLLAIDVLKNSWAALAASGLLLSLFF